MIETIKKACQQEIDMLNQIDMLVRTNNLQNEQWFLDFQDQLNEISVR